MPHVADSMDTIKIRDLKCPELPASQVGVVPFFAEDEGGADVDPRHEVFIAQVIRHDGVASTSVYDLTIHSDPRTAMDAARRNCNMDGDEPRVRSALVGDTKDPYPLD